jgi:RNA polymerase sigma-70 factor (ECF subfamily)
MPRDRPATLGDDPSGDQSFASIVEATAPRMLRLAARLLGDLAEAEDVVQESYVNMYRALSERRFDGRSSLETWIYRVVTNRAIDVLRARQARTRGEGLGAREPSAGVVATPEARLALRELAAWLDQLPAEQRAALVLKEIEGLNTAEVAAVLGCSEGAVEQRLVRARQALRHRRERDER